MSSNRLNFAQRVELELIWGLCKLISWTPFWFKFRVLAPIVYFIVYHCVGYRVKVVTDNLHNAFPEKSEQEISKIKKDFYVYFSEIVVSTIALASKKQNISRNVKSTLMQLKQDVGDNSWILLTSHNGLWEYFVLWGSYLDQTMVAVYHPLRSVVFDELLKRLRTFENIELVPLKECVRFCLRNMNDRPLSIGLIADQRPPMRPNSIWYKFLNQDTIFFDGAEKMSNKLSLPAYFLYQRRVSAGIYEVDYVKICDGDEALPEGEITRRYVEKLESVIEDNPHLWLWSHRRWKQKRKIS